MLSNNVQNRIQLFTPVATALLLTIFAVATGTCGYETNDDMGIIRLLSGQQGISASPDAIFMALPLSTVIYGLYKLFPALPWYGLVMYGSLTTGCAIGLHVVAKSPLPIQNRMLCALAYLGLYASLITKLNFASVSLFLWISVSVGITRRCLTNQDPDIIDWLMGCLMGFSYLIRPDIIQTVAIVVSFPVLAAFWLSPGRKRLIAVVTPIIIIVLTSAIWAHTVRNTPEYKSFSEFNTIRGIFTDTTKSELNKNTSRALAQTGWNIVDYQMAKNYWWLHDSRLFSTSKLETFLKYNNGSSTSLASFQTGKKSLQDQKAGLGIVITICVFMLTGYHTPRSNDRKSQLIVLSAFALTITSILLLMMIRFPARVAIPAFSALVLFATVFRPFIGNAVSVRSNRLSYYFCGISYLIIMTILAQNYRHTTDQTKAVHQNKQYIYNSFSYFQQMAGKNMIFMNTSPYISDFGSEFVSTIKEYRDMPPIISMPTGWLISSPWQSDFLSANNLIDRDHMVPRLINNPGIALVYFDCSQRPFYEFADYFLQHVQFHYGNQFPGTTLLLKTLWDNRADGKSGLIFFTIQAKPSV